MKSHSSTEREEIINDANKAVSQQRNLEYGEPRENFTRCAKMFDAYLGGKESVQAHDVAAFGIMLKLSRISHDPTKRDGWLDVIGYAACGWEVTEKGAPLERPVVDNRWEDVEG